MASAQLPISMEQAQRLLDQHNCHRARYNVAPLEWDWSLAADAQRHGRKCKFDHAPRSELGTQGENLATASRTVNAVDGWFAEEKDWRCGMPIGQDCPPGIMCGHWTQAVWDGTTRIGCAAIDCTGRPRIFDNFVVCRYAPGGNITGRQPVKTCQPKNINCNQLASATFPRVQVPPPSGSPATAPPASAPPAPPRRTPAPAVPAPVPIPSTRRPAPAPTTAPTPAPVPSANNDFLREWQQQQAEWQRQRNGIVPQPSAQPEQPAPPAQQAPPAQPAPAPQPSAPPRIVYPRESQKAVLNRLPPAQLQTLYERVKAVPADVQHCSIEQYLVELGLASPSDYCSSLLTNAPLRTPLVPSMPLVPPATNNALQELSDDELAIIEELATDDAAQDRAPVRADETVNVQAFDVATEPQQQQQQEPAMPAWAWAIIGVVGAILLVLLIVLIVIVATNAQKTAQMQAQLASGAAPSRIVR